MKSYKTLSVAILASILAGCDVPVSINSVSGSVSLNEIYAGAAPVCTTTFGVDNYIGTTVNGNQVRTVAEIWSSGDGSCSGSKTLDESFTLAYDNEGSQDAAWDGAVPDRADGAGPLDDPVYATKLKTTVMADSTGLLTVGAISRTLAYIDDSNSASNYVYYFGSGSGGSDGYPLLMDPTGLGALP